MRTFGSSFPRVNSAVGRFLKNTAEVAARAPTAAGEIAAGEEAAVIGSAIGAAVVGTATVEVHGEAEGIGIAVGVADLRQKIPDDCVPRISIKNRRQKDKNLPRDSSATRF